MGLYIQTESAIVWTRHLQDILVSDKSERLIGSKEETLLVIQARLCLMWMKLATRIEAPQHLPGTRSRPEEDLYQRSIIRSIELSSLRSQILLPPLFIQCGFVAIRKVLRELPLRESPSASVAVLAPTTAWWHAGNEPGSMREKFSGGTPLVFITYCYLLLVLYVRGKTKETCTI